MMAEQEEKSARTKRKKARRAFSLLLERLRGLCETVDQVNEWRDVVAEVGELLQRYQDVIPADRRRQIREALELPETTLKGVTQACEALQFEVEGVIKYLKPAPAIATALTAGLIVVAAGVLAVVVLGNTLAVDMTIHNEGCGDIPVRAALEGGASALAESPFPDLLGIQLPDVIREGSTEVLSIPPVDLEVDNLTDAAELKLRALGEELPVPVSGAVDILFVRGDDVNSTRAEAARIYRALADLAVPIDVVVMRTSTAERYSDLVGTVVRPALREGQVLHARGA
jgi:hypothetical protein